MFIELNRKLGGRIRINAQEIQCIEENNNKEVVITYCFSGQKESHIIVVRDRYEDVCSKLDEAEEKERIKLAMIINSSKKGFDPDKAVEML